MAQEPRGLHPVGEDESHANPGQRHEDELINRSQGAGDSSLREDLHNAENSAAAGAGQDKSGDLASRENNMGYYAKPRHGVARSQAAKEIQAAKGRSADYKAKGGRRRGIFIGLGSGAGLLSVMAGFSALLPMKLPGVLDSIVGAAGNRVEKVIEVRAERLLFLYILRGSTIALNNGAVIATGNPIGDLFANIRTSRFEVDLKTNLGLEFEPGPNKSVRLIHNGKDLGSAKNTEELLKILEKGENGKSLSKADIKKIVKSQIPIWRFWKRAKFVNWLRIKYNVPRWGTREQNPDEKDEDYEKSVKKEHIQRGVGANLENLTEFVDCAADSGDCVDKTDQGDEMKEQVRKAAAEATEELAEEGSEKASKTVVQSMIPRLISAVTSSSTGAALGVAIVGIGWIDIGARLVHGIGQIIDNDLLQKMHANFIKRSSAVVATSYAGYSDQNKAGDMQPNTAGMFANNLDGWEDSVAYGYIQSTALNTPITGEQLDELQKVNESIEPNQFMLIVKNMFGTVGWIGRAPIEAWYYTVSQVFDLIGAALGNAVGWIVEHTPAKALLAQLGNVMGDIFEGILKFVGMYIDPLAVGAQLANYIMQGFLGTFNDKGAEDGMRKLTPEQARTVDAEIREEKIAELRSQSAFDRLFNLENEDSLATRMVATMPTTLASNPLGTLAKNSVGMVGDIPNNLARVTASPAYADTADQKILEEYYGIFAYGGLSSDLETEISPTTMTANAQCPENNPNSFNHCKVDGEVVGSMTCVFVKCNDMYGEAALQNGSLFAYGVEGPRYGPDAVQPKPRVMPNFDGWIASTGGMLASFLPIGALEVTRRRFG